MMKQLIFGMTALSAFATAMPAYAQYQSDPYRGQNQASVQPGYADDMTDRIARLQARIDTGVQTGTISRSEARPLRQQLRALVQLERQYRVNGLTNQERQVLQQRLRGLRQELRIAEGRQPNANGQYGDEDSYDRQGQYNQQGQYGQQYDRVDRNNDGYDDRDLNRDGRYDTRDDEQPAQRGGLGGIVDRVLGGTGLAGGLRVGSRDPGNLGGVPYDYQDRYRDGNGSYYRSDGRTIYQMDTRDRTVIRTYPIGR